MPGVRIPLLLSAAVVIVGALLVRWLFRTAPLSPKRKFDATVAMMGCVGALVSAIFVVFAYYHSVWTMTEASRPRLLLQILPAGVGSDGHPMSTVRYQNRTDNHFDDLRIHLSVESATVGRVELASLFPDPMVMPAGDSRDRTFDPVDVLREHGLDLVGEVGSRVEVRLFAEYSYTFRGELQRVLAQRYEWNWDRSRWELR